MVVVCGWYLVLELVNLCLETYNRWPFAYVCWCASCPLCSVAESRFVFQKDSLVNQFFPDPTVIAIEHVMYGVGWLNESTPAAAAVVVVVVVVVVCVSLRCCRCTDDTLRPLTGWVCMCCCVQARTSVPSGSLVVCRGMLSMSWVLVLCRTFLSSTLLISHWSLSQFVCSSEAARTMV